MTEFVLAQRVEDLTPEWLTEALLRGGVIKDAVVSEARATVIGDGLGFMGILARVELTYDPPQPDAPASLVAKMPTTSSKSRAMAEMLQMYERELRFYRELGPSLKIRTPKLYFGDMEEGPSYESMAGVRKFVEGLPYWLMGLLGLVFMFFARFTRRPNIILMEDLVGMRALDQLEGCDIDFAETVVQKIAAAHAQHWDRPATRALGWVPRADESKHALHLSYRVSIANMRKHLGHTLTDKQTELLDWLDDNYIELSDVTNARPATLVHGDFRLANMFHSEQEGIVTLDWQTAFLGTGLYDIAYFFSGSLEHASQADIDRLLSAYHEGLLEGGVTGYSLQDVALDYRRFLALTLATLVIMVNGLEFQTDDELRELVTVWVKRQGQLLELIRTDDILTQAA